MKEREVVINNQFGGFGLSLEGVMEYAKLSGFPLFAYTVDFSHGYQMDAPVIRAMPGTKAFIIYYLKNDLGDVITREDLNKGEWFHERHIPRDDPNLIKVVRTLKKKANGQCAALEIRKIPADVDFEIEEYDGNEWIAEKHRTWR